MKIEIERPLPSWARLLWLIAILVSIGIIMLPETEAAGTRITDMYRMMRDDFVSMKAKALSMIQLADERIVYYDQLLCSNGEMEFCPAPVVPEVSEGHTKLIVLKNMLATFYNNTRGQTDSSPCSANGVDICKMYDDGLNPIAISQDLWGYPFQKMDKVVLESIDKNPECMEYDGKTMTVIDSKAQCLQRDRDLRTNRCNPDKLITNQIDIFIKCDGNDRDTNYCEKSIVKAKAAGVCHYNVTLL